MDLTKQTKIVERMRKVSAISLLESVLFSNADPSKVSLNDMAIYHRVHYGVLITRQGIAKRFNKKATVFVVALLKQILRTKLSGIDTPFSQTNFNRVIIKDSTCNQLPENLGKHYPGSGGAGSKSAVRVQFEYDLLNHEVCCLDVSAFNKQDIHDAKESLGDIQENDLVIRDLGYVCIETLQGIEGRKAWYISRLNPGTSVYDSGTGGLIDFVDIEVKMKKNTLNSLEKTVLLGEKKHPVRLVIETVPENVKQERIRKATKEAKKKGRALSKEKKARLGLNLFMTNCPASMLSGPELRRIYGIRWQVELIFKAWKQNSQFHRIKKMNLDRYEFLLYAKLIWVMLHWKIYQVLDLILYREKRQRISLLKTFKNIGHFKEKLRCVIRGSKAMFSEVMEDMVDLSKHYLVHDDRKGRVNWRNVKNI